MIIGHSKHSQTIYQYSSVPRPLSLSPNTFGDEKELEDDFSILMESMKVLFVIYCRFYRNGTNFESVFQFP